MVAKAGARLPNQNQRHPEDIHGGACPLTNLRGSPRGSRGTFPPSHLQYRRQQQRRPPEKFRISRVISIREALESFAALRRRPLRHPYGTLRVGHDLGSRRSAGLLPKRSLPLRQVSAFEREGPRYRRRNPREHRGLEAAFQDGRGFEERNRPIGKKLRAERMKARPISDN